MTFYGLSDKGAVRELNQDSYIIAEISENLFFVAVCDGMGGVKGGEIASTIASDIFKERVSALKKKDVKTRELAGAFLRKTLEEANKVIFDKSLEDPSLFGMGTTFVGAVCNGGKVTVINVGDSRAYMIDEERVIQITKDHSLVGEMLENGDITAREANSHPSKNVITRALGVDTSVEADVFDVNVKSGQYLLLCSDGLTNEVSDLEIHFEISNESTPEDACRSLVNIANAHGGHDNVTVLIGAF